MSFSAAMPAAGSPRSPRSKESLAVEKYMAEGYTRVQAIKLFYETSRKKRSEFFGEDDTEKKSAVEPTQCFDAELSVAEKISQFKQSSRQDSTTKFVDSEIDLDGSGGPMLKIDADRRREAKDARLKRESEQVQGEQLQRQGSYRDRKVGSLSISVDEPVDEQSHNKAYQHEDEDEDEDGDDIVAVGHTTEGMEDMDDLHLLDEDSPAKRRPRLRNPEKVNTISNTHNDPAAATTAGTSVGADENKNGSTGATGNMNTNSTAETTAATAAVVTAEDDSKSTSRKHANLPPYQLDDFVDEHDGQTKPFSPDSPFPDLQRDKWGVGPKSMSGSNPGSPASIAPQGTRNATPYEGSQSNSNNSPQPQHSPSYTGSPPQGAPVAGVVSPGKKTLQRKSSGSRLTSRQLIKMASINKSGDPRDLNSSGDKTGAAGAAAAEQERSLQPDASAAGNGTVGSNSNDGDEGVSGIDHHRHSGIIQVPFQHQLSGSVLNLAPLSKLQPKRFTGDYSTEDMDDDDDDDDFYLDADGSWKLKPVPHNSNPNNLHADDIVPIETSQTQQQQEGSATEPTDTPGAGGVSPRTIPTVVSPRGGGLPLSPRSGTDYRNPLTASNRGHSSGNLSAASDTVSVDSKGMKKAHRHRIAPRKSSEQAIQQLSLEERKKILEDAAATHVISPRSDAEMSDSGYASSGSRLMSFSRKNSKLTVRASFLSGEAEEDKKALKARGLLNTDDEEEDELDNEDPAVVTDNVSNVMETAAGDTSAADTGVKLHNKNTTNKNDSTAHGVEGKGDDEGDDDIDGERDEDEKQQQRGNSSGIRRTRSIERAAIAAAKAHEVMDQKEQERLRRREQRQREREKIGLGPQRPSFNSQGDESTAVHSYNPSEDFDGEVQYERLNDVRYPEDDPRYRPTRRERIQQQERRRVHDSRVVKGPTHAQEEASRFYDEVQTLMSKGYTRDEAVLILRGPDYLKQMQMDEEAQQVQPAQHVQEDQYVEEHEHYDDEGGYMMDEAPPNYDDYHNYQHHRTNHSQHTSPRNRRASSHHQHHHNHHHGEESPHVRVPVRAEQLTGFRDRDISILMDRGHAREEAVLIFEEIERQRPYAQHGHSESRPGGKTGGKTDRRNSHQVDAPPGRNQQSRSHSQSLELEHYRSHSRSGSGVNGFVGYEEETISNYTESSRGAPSSSNTENDVLLMNLLLSQQIAKFGINMYDALAAEDEPYIEMYMKQGQSLDQAVLRVFEARYGTVDAITANAMPMETPPPAPGPYPQQQLPQPQLQPQYQPQPVVAGNPSYSQQLPDPQYQAQYQPPVQHQEPPPPPVPAVDPGARPELIRYDIADNLEAEIELLMVSGGYTREAAVKILLQKANKAKIAQYTTPPPLAVMQDQAPLQMQQQQQQAPSYSNQQAALQQQAVISPSSAQPRPQLQQQLSRSGSTSFRVEQQRQISTASLSRPSSFISNASPPARTPTAASRAGSVSGSLHNSGAGPGAGAEGSAAEDRATQVTILLSQQEATYGVNMFDFITQRPPLEAEVRSRIAQGFSRHDAMLAVFERHAPPAPAPGSNTGSGSSSSGSGTAASQELERLREEAELAEALRLSLQENQNTPGAVSMPGVNSGNNSTAGSVAGAGNRGGAYSSSGSSRPGSVGHTTSSRDAAGAYSTPSPYTDRSSSGVYSNGGYPAMQQQQQQQPQPHYDHSSSSRGPYSQTGGPGASPMGQGYPPLGGSGYAAGGYQQQGYPQQQQQGYPQQQQGYPQQQQGYPPQQQQGYPQQQQGYPPQQQQGYPQQQQQGYPQQQQGYPGYGDTSSQRHSDGGGGSGFGLPAGVTQQNVDLVIGMGFTRAQAMQALAKHRNNVNSAVDELCGAF